MSPNPSEALPTEKILNVAYERVDRMHYVHTTRIDQ